MCVWKRGGYVGTLLVLYVVTLLTTVEVVARLYILDTCANKEACKMNGKCVLPGISYTNGCNTFKISRTADGCHSEIDERGCMHNGKCVLNGAEVMKQTLKSCVKLQCTRGMLLRVDLECLHEGKCLPEGEHVLIQKRKYCVKRRCTSGRLRLVSTECLHEGKCLPEGEHVLIQKPEYCVKRRCTSGRLRLVSTGCMRKGKCLRHGQLVLSHNRRYCVKRRCIRGKLRLVGQGCWSKENKCMFVTKYRKHIYRLFIGKRSCTGVCSKRRRSTHIQVAHCSKR